MRLMLDLRKFIEAKCLMGSLSVRGIVCPLFSRLVMNILLWIPEYERGFSYAIVHYLVVIPVIKFPVVSIVKHSGIVNGH